jgi:hypothetical protein
VTSVLQGGAWSASRPVRFIPGEKTPCTYWIGDCVGPRAGLDAVEKRTIYCPWRESNLGRPTRSWSLNYFTTLIYRLTFHVAVYKPDVTETAGRSAKLVLASTVILVLSETRMCLEIGTPLALGKGLMFLCRLHVCCTVVSALTLCWPSPAHYWFRDPWDSRPYFTAWRLWDHSDSNHLLNSKAHPTLT